MDQGHQFVLVTAPDARPYVRMVTERLFPTLPVLSHLEIARGVADQVARHDLVTSDRPGDRARGLPDLLPDRRLPDADAGLFQLARSGAGAPVHRRSSVTLALTPLLEPVAARDARQPALDAMMRR